MTYKTDKHGWIKVEDGLPRPGDMVLIAFNGYVTGGYLINTGQWLIVFVGISTPVPVTHWQPLPPNPERE